VLGLAGGLSETDWRAATDCPGWTVHDVVAHLAAIEHELATGQRPVVEISGTTAVSEYTEAGVAERRTMPPADLVEQLRAGVQTRRDLLEASPPDDLSARADRAPGNIGWDWRTLLRNRAIDMWVHEQDIRRALGRPGGMNGPGARLTASTFLAALPFVIARRAAAPAGAVVTLVLDGTHFDFAVTDDGHCAAVESASGLATVTLRMDTEALTILGAGRRDPAIVGVHIDGDRELGARVLAGMAVTP
jgi:uncharacterized protein (TIGR03083 family)